MHRNTNAHTHTHTRTHAHTHRPYHTTHTCRCSSLHTSEGLLCRRHELFELHKRVPEPMRSQPHGQPCTMLSTTTAAGEWAWAWGSTGMRVCGDECGGCARPRRGRDLRPVCREELFLELVQVRKRDLTDSAWLSMLLQKQLIGRCAAWGRAPPARLSCDPVQHHYCFAGW